MCGISTEDEVDTAVFGKKRYTILGRGGREWLANAKKQFPENTEDIDK